MWQDDFARVIRTADRGYPVYRVILKRHIAEMTDLPRGERERLMNVVYAVEATLRRLVHPEKMNMACFGNRVPHVHWHVVARFADDPHYPEPIWNAKLRDGRIRPAPSDEAFVATLAELIA